VSATSRTTTGTRRELRQKRDELLRECRGLEEEVDKYKDLYENAPDMYGLLDAETATILECNNAMVRLLGYPREEIVGKPIFDFHPADQHGRMIEMVEAFRKTGESPDAELDYLHRDGSRSPATARVSPVYDENGRLVRARSVMRDITHHRQIEADLRRSEEQFRRLAETIQMVPWEAKFTPTLDAEGNDPELVRLDENRRGRFEFTYVGPQSAKLTGFASTKGRAPESWWEMVHSDDRDKIARQLMSLLSEGGTASLEYRVIGGDGRTVWLLNRYSAVKEYDGSVTLTGVVIDITDRKVASDRRNRVMRELDHRVKNTLTVVRAVADQTARSSDTWESFKELLSSRVRALARIHAALSERDWSGMAMNALVSAACGKLEGFRCYGQTTAVPLEIAQPLGMALREMATNARMHGSLSARGGGVTLRWTLVNHVRSGRSLRIEWSEHGGPPPRAQRRRGYGTYLLEEALPYEVDAETHSTFAPTGFRCSILIPVPNAQSG
jgi:PAS domain S-box-containing protein